MLFRSYTIGKWFGACNDAKAALDQCFRREKEIRRRENMRKAREFDAKFEEYMKQKEAAEKSLSLSTIPSSTDKST